MSQIKASAGISQETARTGLQLLMVLWAGSLFGSFLFEGEVATWGRMTSSAALVAAGWTWFLVLRDAGLSSQALTAGRRYVFGIAMGMTLGFVGDLCNAEIIPLPNQTMGGIAAFGTGHVFYIMACLGIGRFLKLDRPGVKYGALAFCLALGAIGWVVVTITLEKWNIVHWAALPYAMLLAGTMGCALGLALQDKAFTMLTLGATLFFLSDLVLAFRLFHGSFWMAGFFVWILYGPGQMLIVYSTGLAIARLRERQA